MASSLVFASGFVKSVGRYLLQQWHMSEFFMPFATGLVFALPLFEFVYLLNCIPPPTAADAAERSERRPMTGKDRLQFFNHYWPGILLICATYLMLTVVRDVRDNFEVEIWSSLGFGKQPAIFTQIDLPVAIAVLAVMALLIRVKDNLKAFVLIHLIILTGLMVVLTATFMYNAGSLNAIAWMAAAAFGLYLAYVPYNSIYFERMIAAFRIVGNVGFVMYLADAMGYLASVTVLLYKQFGTGSISWLHFYSNGLVIVSLGGIATILLSLVFFIKRHKKERTH
ncbi:MAG: hypothetical protein EBZ77_13830 [Chitinophagia bacterium]|nr:hypothetical protein [Chitinophagia bacterium]